MQNKTQMAVHGLGRGEGFGFAGLSAKNSPIHIGAQLLAHDAAAGKLFDLRAAFGGDWPVSLHPLVNGRRLHTHGPSQAGLTTENVGGLENWIRHSLIMRLSLIAVNRNCLT